MRQSLRGKTLAQIKDLEDPRLLEAVVMPEAPRKATRLFTFLRDNQNMVTAVSGMDYFITGVDRHKLTELAKGYHIEIFRYMFAVDMFENKLLERQERRRNAK